MYSAQYTTRSTHGEAIKQSTVVCQISWDTAMLSPSTLAQAML